MKTNIQNASTTRQSVRSCTPSDLHCMKEIINAAAESYRGVIPPDRWHDPYMPMDELRDEIERGVVFSGCEIDGDLAGVMGIQRVRDVDLIRHAYVLPARQGHGVGSSLLSHLRGEAPGQIMIGTWSAADWAIRFYQRHGFTLTDEKTKTALLKDYWSIPDRQVETSVVLALLPVDRLDDGTNAPSTPMNGGLL